LFSATRTEKEPLIRTCSSPLPSVRGFESPPPPSLFLQVSPPLPPIRPASPTLPPPLSRPAVLCSSIRRPGGGTPSRPFRDPSSARVRYRAIPPSLARKGRDYRATTSAEPVPLSTPSTPSTRPHVPAPRRAGVGTAHRRSSVVSHPAPKWEFMGLSCA